MFELPTVTSFFLPFFFLHIYYIYIYIYYVYAAYTFYYYYYYSHILFHLWSERRRYRRCDYDDANILQNRYYILFVDIKLLCKPLRVDHNTFQIVPIVVKIEINPIRTITLGTNSLVGIIFLIWLNIIIPYKRFSNSALTPRLSRCVSVIILTDKVFRIKMRQLLYKDTRPRKIIHIYIAV